MDTEVTFGKLVASYRGKKRWTQNEVARQVGTSRRSISDIETGARQQGQIGSGLFQKLIEVLEIPWEEVPKLTPGVIDQVKETIAKYAKEGIDFRPVLDIDDCHAWHNWPELAFPAQAAQDVHPTTSRDPQAFFLVARHEQRRRRVEAFYRNDDMLLIEPGRRPRHNDLVFFLYEGKPMLRLYQSVNGYVLFKSDDPLDPTIILSDDVAMCLPVTQIIRKIK